MAKAVVSAVCPGSIAEEIGIAPGDVIVSINSVGITDILDYKFLTADASITLEILKPDGLTDVVEIDTDYEDLGIIFENSLIDTAKSCKNKCVFCFIDQLPKGMRKTLYFKDDDARLSFLQGNYITLTNLSDEDIDRIIRMRISPVNVSVHTTDPELRIFMLKNKGAGRVYEILERLADNHITTNCQIVCCPNINDQEHLDRSIGDLGRLYPSVDSLSVVPVGLTAYRDGLCDISPFNQESARLIIKQIEGWQQRFLAEHGSRIVYAADEFYLMAGLDIPPEEAYEGFPQIENGVGLIASMQAEFDDGIEQIIWQPHSRKVSIATGELAYPFIRGLADRLEQACAGLEVSVYPIQNNFFGGQVSVAGLVCGIDLLTQLTDKPLGEALFIPSSMLRAEEDVFLDDTTLEKLSSCLKVPIIPVNNDGYGFIENLLGEKDCCAIFLEKAAYASFSSNGNSEEFPIM